MTAVPMLVLTLLGTGCGATETDGDRGVDDRNSPRQSPLTASPAPPTGGATSEPAGDQEHHMEIRITIGDQTFGATLRDSAAARDLLAQLPVTVEMTDHGGVEKTGPLPGQLSLEGQPEGADPDVGDLGYYAPGHDLVLYYGDQSYFPGIVVLGRMNGDAPQRIADMDGSLTATVAAR
jgi:hypothetical protein